MTLQQLNYLVTVADCGNITEAADKLFISQPSLSAAIHNLEKEMGARALRAVIEEFMLDIMYEIPKDDNIGAVEITEEYIEGTGGPQITMRTQALLPKNE